MSITEQLTNKSTETDSKDGELLSMNASDSLEKSVIFDVLQNERRRYLLRYLDAAGKEVKIGELAEVLAGREADDDTYDHRDRKRTYVSLYQTHLPKLADVGIVEYDRRSKRVRLASAFDHIEPYLYDRLDRPIRWDHLYLLAGLIGLGVVIPGYLWSSSTALIPEGAWIGLFVGICGFLIAAHLAYSAEWINVEWLREE